MRTCGRGDFMAYDESKVPMSKLAAAMKLCDQEGELTVTSLVGSVAKNTLEAHMIVTVLFGSEKLYPIGKSRFVSHGKTMPVVVWRRRNSKIQVRSAKGLGTIDKWRKGKRVQSTEKPEESVKRERVKADFSDEP